VFTCQVFQIVRVTVDVLSVNRHAPRFPRSRVHLSVPVAARPGAAWALPAADDPDGGREGVQTYRLEPPTASATFALDVVRLPDDSREIRLRLVQTLNRSVLSVGFDSSASYSVLVLAFCVEFCNDAVHANMPSLVYKVASVFTLF